jgi:hypothetical protein
MEKQKFGKQRAEIADYGKRGNGPRDHAEETADYRTTDYGTTRAQKGGRGRFFHGV